MLMRLSRIAAMLALAAGGLVLSVSVPARALDLKLILNTEFGPETRTAAAAFAEAVAKATSGRHRATSEVVGESDDDGALVAELAAGKLAFAVITQPAGEAVAGEAKVIAAPFLFPNRDIAHRALDGGIGEAIAPKFKAKGLVLLGTWDVGFRHLANGLRPVVKPHHLHGMRVRVPFRDSTIKMFEALAADPKPMRFFDLQARLQLGVVDGFEDQLVEMGSGPLMPYVKYVSLWTHQYECAFLVGSEPLWKDLDPADRQALLAAARDATQRQRQLVGETQAGTRRKLEAQGTVFNEVDNDAVFAALPDEIKEPKEIPAAFLRSMRAVVAAVGK